MNRIMCDLSGYDGPNPPFEALRFVSNAELATSGRDKQAKGTRSHANKRHMQPAQIIP